MKPKAIAMLVALFCLGGCAQPADLAEVDDASWGESFAACMAERGWTVTVDDDGGVEGGYVEGQATAFRADSDACYAAASTDEPLTEARYENHYAALLATRECIIDQGYDLQAPPSYQAWRDADARWSPHRELVDAGIADSEFASLDEACPQPTEEG